MIHKPIVRSVSSLIAALFLLVTLAPAAKATEIVTLIDTDRDAATGCVRHGLSGVDAIVTAETATTPAGSFVSSLRVQSCSAAILGHAVQLGGGWPVPRDTQRFSVETYVPYAQLGISRTTPARYAVVVLQQDAAPLRVPGDGSWLTFAAPSRRRAAGPSLEGPAHAADGNLAEWVTSETIREESGVSVWMSAGPDALFFRFDVASGAPVAHDDEYAAPEGNTLTVDAPGVLANDDDADGDPLTAELVTNASHGTVALAEDGSFVYQPTGAPSPDAFTYRARDPYSASAPATVVLTPVAVTQPPVGEADAYPTAEDQQLVVAAPGVLANDSDPDGDALTAVLDAAPAQGTLALQSDGAFTYTPVPNANGVVTFTYRVSDGITTSAPVTVTITIDPVNDPPTFNAGNDVTVAEDSGAYANAWATSISAGPNETESVTFELVTNSNPSLFNVAPSIAPNGQLSFTPTLNANGDASITVRLNDGTDTSTNATFTIHVTPMNDAPAFTLPATAPAVNEDAGAQTIANFATAISAGPADESGQVLTFSVTQTSSDPTLTFSVAPALAADGTLTYTAAANAYGTAMFDVVLTDDAAGSSSTHTFTITVNPVNDAPTFTAGSDVTVAEDSGAYANAWATGISAGPNETESVTFELVTNSNPSLFSVAPAIGANGQLTFTPALNANGDASITVHLNDGTDTSTNATFTIHVTPVNDAPSFTLPPSAPAINEDAGAQTIANFATAISAGPADESGQVLTFSVTQTSSDPTLTFSVAPALAADGTLTYTAAANAYGTATFDVILTDDASGASSTHAFTITVNPVNDAPTFTVGSDVTVAEDSGAYANAWATSISGGPNETESVTFELVTNSNPSLFSVAPAIAANGQLTFMPALNANGDASITVRLNDGTDTSTNATFTIHVTPVNDAPSFTLPATAPAINEDAGPQSLANLATAISAGPADESGQVLTFNVTQASSDPTLTFSVAPALAADGTLTYTAAANAYGTATFDVVLTDDASGASSTHTFTITVTPVNDAPTFIAGNDVTVAEDSGAYANAWATSISAGPNETGSVTFELVTNTNPSLFSVAPSIAANGQLTFTPALNGNGDAAITVRLNDGTDVSTNATFTIHVTAVNDAPSFTLPATAPAVNEDAGAQTVATFATAISAGPADESGQVLTFNVTQASADATLTFSIAPAIAADGTLIYTPAANAYGVATFDVILTDDASGSSSTQTFTITVNPVNDAPTFMAGNDVTVAEDSGAYANAWATGISAGPNETGGVTFELVTNSNPSLFSVAPAIAPNGQLTFTPALNANGDASITVRLNDGTDTSTNATFTIHVTPVNDAPSFALPAAAPAVNEDAGAQTLANFATAISAGPADESGQVLTFNVTQASADATLTFSVAPAIAADGTLTYTPAANANGVATFDVILTDDAAGSSTTHTFTITVNPVNDAPTFTGGNDVTVAEDSGAYANAWATSISAGPNETGSVTFELVTNSNPTLFSVAPAIAANGQLSFTPALNANGDASITVRLNDGTDTSTNATFTIHVTPVNDAPSFTLPASAPPVNEDAGAQTIANFATAISAGPADESGQAVTFNVTQTASDPTLAFSVAPSLAANGTLTYTAALDAYGTATFDVVLTDDAAGTSATHTFSITVAPVNDAPIAGDDNFAYPADGSTLTVAAPGVLSNDTDLDSAGLTAALVAGPSEGVLLLQSDGSFTYAKAASPAGTSVTFTYRVSDGLAFSNTATVTITLNAPPVAADDAYTLLEDHQLTTPAPGLLDNDSDPDGNIVLVQPVSGPDCAGYAADTCGSLSLALAQDGSFVYQPPVDFNGVVTFTYKLVDAGGLESAPATATITVVPVNDAPNFDVDVVDASAAQNSTLQTVAFATNVTKGPATATDESSQHVHFEIDVYLGANLLKPFVDAGSGIASTTGVDIDPTGTLRFQPGATTGTVHMSVRVVDDGGTDNGGVDASDAVDVTLRITAAVINKAPSFNITNLTVNEDAAAQSINNWVTSLSQGSGETGQTVNVTVDSFTNPSLFDVAPAIVSNNRLTYTLAPNANGTSTLTIKAQDNGGTANGGIDTTTKTATITVNAVNDAPSFTKGADLVYGSDTAGLQTVPWATAISAGPSNESAQTLTFSATVRSGASILTGTPSIASNGTLTFTLNGTTGLAVIDVRLSDNGGTANGGVNQSAIQTFTINAGGVNTPPSFVKSADPTVLEDSGPATYAGWATSISQGRAGETGQTVTFNVTATTPSLFSVQPAINTSGTLTFTPAANQFGSTTVTVTAVDDGGTSGGGVNTSDPQTFTITIRGVNDAPVLSIPSPAVSGGENGGPRTINTFASATPGAGETGQTPFTYNVTQTGGSATLFDAGNGGVAPTISATGVLTFTTAVNASGSATFSVTVTDAGGTANSGVDTSSALSFTINIATGGPVVPGTGITFDAYANIPITVGSAVAEASYNLLDGATDPDLPLSVLITSKPTNARVDVAADGSFTFRSGNLTYAGGATQPQSFKWRVCDAIGNCSAERTATVNFIGPLVFFSDATAVTSPGLYTLDVPGKSIPTGFTTNATPAATYIIKSGTYSMGTTGATTQLSLRAGDKVYGQGTAGLTLGSLGITQAALAVGTLPALPDYSTGTIPTLHMPDPTATSGGGGIVITQSPFFKGYGGGSVKHLRFTRAAERTASWILFSNASWTSTPGDYVFDDIISVNGQGFAIPQVGSSITVSNSDLTLSEGFGMNGGTITVTNTPIKLTSTDTSASSILFSDFDSNTVGTITATIDANSPITIANNVGYLFPLTISNPAWMPNGTFTIDSDITITRTSTTVGLYMKLMSNVALNGKVTVTTATGKPVQLSDMTNLVMPNAANTAKMTATPSSLLNGGITMTNVNAGTSGINLVNVDVHKGYLAFDTTSGGPITITGGTVVGDLINPCIGLSNAANVTVTGVTTSNCGF